MVGPTRLWRKTQTLMLIASSCVGLTRACIFRRVFAFMMDCRSSPATTLQVERPGSLFDFGGGRGGGERALETGKIGARQVRDRHVGEIRVAPAFHIITGNGLI